MIQQQLRHWKTPVPKLSHGVEYWRLPADRRQGNITRIDADLKQMVRTMFELMYATNGIGLAANQVAVPLRLFIMNATGSAAESVAEHVFLNAEIVRRKGSAEAEEGCLSLPGLYGQVRRSEQIVVNAFDLEGQEFEMDLEDLEARVVQHENDHIDGILFIDRMTEAARRELDPRTEPIPKQRTNSDR